MINCSLIIRTKNEEENLGHCIKAIKSQSIKNVEIIIVDNLSSDNTLKIARSLGVNKIISIKDDYKFLLPKLGSHLVVLIGIK